MAPSQVVRWIRQEYPKPVVAQEWLDACCEWVEKELHIDPNSQTAEFVYEVEAQLLNSNLGESMVDWTGFPQDATSLNDVKLKTPVLVEIISIMEIGHSAFSLYNTRQTRIERADLSGLATEEGIENDEGPVPNYPRSMLSFELFDGSVTMKAIEYKPLPQLKLGETPLGYKIQIKEALIRRGVLYLEPNSIVLKGHRTEERDAFRDRDFLHGLYRRLGKPIPLDEDGRDDRSQNSNKAPSMSVSGAFTEIQSGNGRAPFRELSEPPESDIVSIEQDADLPRKRRVPNPTAPASSSTLVNSPFFEDGEQAARMQTLSTASSSTRILSRILSPVRGEPIDLEDSSVEISEPLPRGLSVAAAGKQRQEIPSSPFPNQRKCDNYSYEIDLTSDVEIDDSFLAQIDKAERAAREGSRATPQPTNSRLRTPIPDFVSRSRSESRAPSASPMPGAQDIITIDDNDENDKENIPVTARRVRRRISDLPDAIIDLSD